jgi:copper chaperone
VPLVPCGCWPAALLESHPCIVRTKLVVSNMSKVVHFRVGMTCGGCSKAVTKVLGKIEGVEDVVATVEEKTVDVTCADDTSADDLLAALMKWSKVSGKEVELLA